jgi:hypothetical protein
MILNYLIPRVHRISNADLVCGLDNETVVYRLRLFHDPREPCQGDKMGH